MFRRQRSHSCDLIFIRYKFWTSFYGWKFLFFFHRQNIWFSLVAANEPCIENSSLQINSQLVEYLFMIKHPNGMDLWMGQIRIIHELYSHFVCMLIIDKLKKGNKRNIHIWCFCCLKLAGFKVAVCGVLSISSVKESVFSVKTMAKNMQ